MISTLPFLIVILPLILAVTTARAAWLWLSLPLGAGLVYAVTQYTAAALAAGGTGWPFGWAVPQGPDSLSLTSFFLNAEARRLVLSMLPALLPALALFGVGHAERARWDLALFWLFAIFALANLYGPTLALGHIGMPRRYAEYDELLERVTGLAQFAGFLALATLVAATLRPIFLVIRRRMA